MFRPIPDAEYVVLFVERLMAREVGCCGTDRLTYTHDNNYRNPHCARAPRVNNVRMSINLVLCVLAVIWGFPQEYCRQQPSC